MWGVRKQGRKQKGSRERKQSRGGNKKPNKKLPPIPPPSPFPRKRESPDSSASGANPPPKAGKNKIPAKGGKNGRFPLSREWRIFSPNSPHPHFFIPPIFLLSPIPQFPPFPPLFHSRESGNLPTPAPAARIPRESGKNGRFIPPIPLSLLFSFPPFFYYPRESGNLPTPAPLARIPPAGNPQKSPASAGNPPKSPYPLRAEKKYPPRPLIVPPRPRLTKKQHQSAFFCILLRFGRQKMVFYRVMGVPPASEAHLFRHWRKK